MQKTLHFPSEEQQAIELGQNIVTAMKAQGLSPEVDADTGALISSVLILVAWEIQRFQDENGVTIFMRPVALRPFLQESFLEKTA